MSDSDQERKPAPRRRRGVLARLLASRLGSTSMITAFAAVPILGIIGGGVDAARGYAVKSRLQHACDSGALAIRRTMSGSTPTTTDIAEGNKFFNFNFAQDMFGIGPTAVSKNFAAGTAPGTVKGTATAQIDMTLMRIFGWNQITVSVDCEATVSVPNTDVMFVLDVTGSMTATPSGDTISKLAALKLAVKDFYTELGAGTASGAGRVRYGFVPYSATVNVGNLIKNNANWFLGATAGDTAPYMTRTPNLGTEWYITSYGPESAHTYGTTYDSTYYWPTSWTNYGTSGSTTISGTAYTNRITNITSSTCSARAIPAATDASTTSAVGPTLSSTVDPTYPATTSTRYYNTTQNFNRTQYGYGWTRTSGSGASALGTCQFRRRTTTSAFTRTTPSTTTRTVTWDSRPILTSWTYNIADVDVSDVVQNGTAPNPTYWGGVFQSGQSNGTTGSSGGTPSATMSWGGCIEEPPGLNTITASTVGLTIPSNAYDMLIDHSPASNEQKWRPYMPELQYESSGSGTRWYASSYYVGLGSSACPSASAKLTSYAGNTAGFNAYVDGLSAVGGTYHDIGLIWGARLLSPTGLFSSENSDATAPGGFQISRHLVFMTDGTIDVKPWNNSAWGIPQYQGRDGQTSDGETTLEANHSKRTEMICEAAKAKGFTIWVIGFGITSLPTALSNCASSADHASIASNSTAIRERFRAIAETIGGLRLSE